MKDDPAVAAIYAATERTAGDIARRMFKDMLHQCGGRVVVAVARANLRESVAALVAAQGHRPAYNFAQKVVDEIVEDEARANRDDRS